MEAVKSGIYYTIGDEKKDMVTEATAQEFREWMAARGFNIDFVSDSSLNGELLDERVPFLQWQLRCAYIMDAESVGIIVYRVKEEWDAFKITFREEAERHYG